MDTAIAQLSFPHAETQELSSLLALAQKGDLTVLPQLRASLDSQPDLARCMDLYRAR